MPTIGFACAWWVPKESTWSYTPTRLLRALQASDSAHVLDLDVQIPISQRAVLAGCARPRPAVPWKYRSTYQWLLDRRVRKRVARVDPDAVLEIADVVVPTNVPTFAYQDMNFSVALENLDRVGAANVSTLPSRRDGLERLAARENARYSELQGVIAMSDWYRCWLIDRLDLPPERVHVVHAGLNNPPTMARTHVDPTGAHVLFVGGEFYRKGGDVLVAACERARRHSPHLRLTVAGPSKLPPQLRDRDWIDFRGALAPEKVAALYAEADLFVMPSRFEAFGIALLEARAAGLPCIATNHMAMPEIVPPHAGRLVPPEDVEALASAITTCLEDLELRARAVEGAADVAATWSWARAAAEMQRIVLAA